MTDDLLFDGRPFDRRQADEQGMGPERMRELLRNGAVRHVLFGVYLDARVPDDLASRVQCLGLRLPQGAAVCRSTAAWLYGVDARSPDETRAAPIVECVVPEGREPVARPGVRGFVAPVEPGDVQLVGGLPCTTPLRTAVDVLRWFRPHMGLAVADALAARRLVDAFDLPVEVERWAGRRGVAQARYLAAHVEPRTESFGESWLRLRMIDAGFPRPVAQIELPGDGAPVRYRLDLGWPRRRLGVEYDGEEFHSSPEQRRHDEARRDDLLRGYGWTVIGVGKGEVLGPSTLLERTIGGLLDMTPRTTRRRW